MAKKLYLVIHGHFYQPPREDPWTGEISPEPSAAPEHDWNERVNQECYRPNASSRVLDCSGSIKKIVNNFEYISFNIGPTLLTWMEKNDPVTYKHIIDSDHISSVRYGGHGSAIAQVYHHVILPLQTEFMSEIQILWAISDFRHRYKRDPESIWLSEMAINQKTVDLLIRFNIRYIILSPTQALKIRKFNDHNAEWIDVSNNSIITTRPYRCFSYDESNNRCDDKFINIFFYDGVLSQAIAFEHLLKDADSFLNKILKTCESIPTDTGIINIATDGESYGHHEPFGDMCLSALIEKINSRSDIELTNYGHLLDVIEPKYEVILKPGKNGEGTAWSCAHSVDRWQDNCGCQTGGQTGWNQEWRRPIRDAFNLIYNTIETDIRPEMKQYIKNQEDAIRNYITVILNPGNKEIQTEFISKHIITSETLNDYSVITKVLSWLEMERYAMAMFTSCAWFFADISGIETVQNLKIAYYVLSFFPNDLKKSTLEQVLAVLKSAKSNILEWSDGRYIFKEWVMKNSRPAEKMIAHYLMRFFSGISGNNDYFRNHYHKTFISDFFNWHDSRIMVTHGNIENVNTRISIDYISITWQHTALSMDVFIKFQDKKESYQVYINKVLNIISNDYDYTKGKNEFLKIFSDAYFRLFDLDPDSQTNILWNLSASIEDDVSKNIDTIFELHDEFIYACLESGIPLRPILLEICKMKMNNKLDKLVLSVSDEPPEQYLPEFGRLLRYAYNGRFMLQTDKLKKLLEDKVLHFLKSDKDILPDENSMNNAMKIILFVERWRLKLFWSSTQDLLYGIIFDKLGGKIKDLTTNPDDIAYYQRITKLIDIAEHLNISTDHIAQSLKNYERMLK